MATLIGPPATLPEQVTILADRIVEEFLPSDGMGSWAAWRPDGDGRVVARAGNPIVYDGDAGIALACAELAVDLDRSDLVDCAVLSARHALARAQHAPTTDGLLDGAAGVAAAVHQVGALLDEHALTTKATALLRSLPAPGTDPDLTSGVAGRLLAILSMGASHHEIDTLVDALQQGAWSRHRLTCWPADYGSTGNPTANDIVALCGLAHGASGIVLALARALTSGAFDRAPDTRDDVRRAIAGGLDWESTWFDARTCNWADLRPRGPDDPPVAAQEGGMVAWCHGAIGIGLTRLALLEEVEKGADFGVPADSLTADIEAALQTTVRAADAAPVLGMCHGAPGHWLLLARAGDVFGDEVHQDTAAQLASTKLSAAGPIAQWQSGYPGMPFDCGLMTGLAGAALAIARASGIDRRPLWCQLV